MPISNLIDYGRFEHQHDVTIDGSPFWKGTSEYGEEPTSDWSWRYREGNTCPDCGKLIEDVSEYCQSCRRLRDEDFDADSVIRERPLREIDPVEYGLRLRARVQARKLAALSLRRKAAE